METILITGGTGLVGKALTEQLLQKGYHVIVLTRTLPASSKKDERVEYALWDVQQKKIDIAAFQEADHIIHLAGAGVVDKKWTAAYRKEIQDSRTKSSDLLIDTMQKNANKIKTVVSASAIGWYGEDGETGTGKHGFTESDQPDTGFLGETCRLWEESIDPVTDLQKRLVKLRTGIVLSNDGGALVEFKKPIRFGIAAILSNGKQVVSWIHIKDLCRMYINAIENTTISGVYNAVAPLPVPNKNLTIELATQMKGKFFIPVHVPSFILKLMMGERSIEVLKSTTVSSRKIVESGFTFCYPTIQSAIKDLRGK